MPLPDPQLLYVDPVDSATDEQMVSELYYSQIAKHPFYVLNQAAPLNIYGEPTGDPQYTLVTPAFPIQIKLAPEEELLTRFGYDRKRDAILWFATPILIAVGVKPKVGDRVHFVYYDSQGSTVVEDLILDTVHDWDFSRQTAIPYQVTATAERTQLRIN